MRLLAAAALAALLVALPARNAPVASQKAFGSAQAPVTMEVFSDFQCPACKNLHETTLRMVKENYVKKGKVYLIHRDFPLPNHAHARIAATWAVAASRFGKYEAVADALFRTQTDWSVSGNVDKAAASALTAAEATKVRAMLKDPQIAAEIDKDVAAGQQVKLQQTPTVVISHKGQKYPVAGVISYDIMQRFIEMLLAQ
jgi:protein-disulfide isomerase